MADTLTPPSKRDVYYFRRRHQNRVHARLAEFFVEEASRTGVTKAEIARRLDLDPAQITRLLMHPSNLTLDSISDFLLALGAEAEPPEIVRFADRSKPNDAHPLIAKILGQAPAPKPAKSATSNTSRTAVAQFELEPA